MFTKLWIYCPYFLEIFQFLYFLHFLLFFANFFILTFLAISTFPHLRICLHYSKLEIPFKHTFVQILRPLLGVYELFLDVMRKKISKKCKCNNLDKQRAPRRGQRPPKWPKVPFSPPQELEGVAHSAPKLPIKYK